MTCVYELEQRNPSATPPGDLPDPMGLPACISYFTHCCGKPVTQQLQGGSDCLGSPVKGAVFM